tara:strand:- start:342 stop:701 length:360 start_codon:yes stop_codon:yes gene_type:complete
MSNHINENTVIDVLKQCFDPEIPIDLWNLGLIYKIEIKPATNDKHDIYVLMTLTTPGCTMGQHMSNDIKTKLENIQGINEVNVEVTFDPPWEPEMMTDEARTKLGFSNPSQTKENTNWE